VSAAASSALDAPAEEPDDRWTPQWLFNEWDAINHFTIDLAASAENTKCARYYTKGDDALSKSWAGERGWLNCPYSDIYPWVAKAFHEVVSNDCDRIVMLLPATRTEQPWWQEFVEPNRDDGGIVSTLFLPKRFNFDKPPTSRRKNSSPRFGCCVVVFMKPIQVMP
jgi:phage N-6-adenine-methyltransferase